MKLVDCISVFRIRYVVDTDNNDFAADTVVMEEAKEFSQRHITEDIVSIRTIDKDEYLRLFDEDNEYLEGWDEEKKLSFITRLDDE
jgi:hypothetical protein